MEFLLNKQNLRFRRNQKTTEVIIFLISLACIFLFLSSAYTKVVDHERFVRGLENVSFLKGIAPLVGWAVPATEIIVAILLIIPRTYRLGLFGFGGLMTTFTIYIAGMMLWAEKLPCGCNLFIETLSWGQHLIFNIGFIFLSIYALWLSKKQFIAIRL